MCRVGFLIALLAIRSLPSVEYFNEHLSLLNKQDLIILPSLIVALQPFGMAETRYLKLFLPKHFPLYNHLQLNNP